MTHQVEIPSVLLNSGHKMPMIGLGTACFPLPPKDELLSTFLDAIEAGYRLFDTAKPYGNEDIIGEAIRVALDRGLIESRHQVFISTKLWCTDAHPDLVLPALQDSLERLGTSYVDLYLIHWPVRLKPDTNFFKPFPKSDLLTFDIKGIWKAMEYCHQLGLAKSIGVGNYTRKKLLQVFEMATIPPSVNQVEMNVTWQQKELIDFCKEKNIHVMARSPLGSNNTFYGSAALLDSSVLKSIAATKQKTVAQVGLRWIHEQGIVSIPKSFNKERMKENLQILDWKLTEEEITQIHQIPQKRFFRMDMFINPEGQYKTLAEFWDEE